MPNPPVRTEGDPLTYYTKKQLWKKFNAITPRPTDSLRALWKLIPMDEQMDFIEEWISSGKTVLELPIAMLTDCATKDETLEPDIGTWLATNPNPNLAIGFLLYQ